MKIIFIVAMTILFKITIASEIDYLVKETKETISLNQSLKLGNKKFSSSECSTFDQDDLDFLKKINNPSYSPCCTGLSHKVIRQEDYEFLKKNVAHKVLKNLSIQAKSESREFWQDCSDCREKKLSCSLNQWAQGGLLTGIIPTAIGCVLSGVYCQGTCWIVPSLLVPIPCFTILGEIANRLHYRFFIKEKNIQFDEQGKELE